MKKLKKHLPTIILILVFVIGLSLLVYPTFADWYNSFHQTKAIASYTEEVAGLDDDKYADILESAMAYNEWLYESNHGLGLDDDELEAYEAELSLETTSVMAYIEIPKIDVYLPIYHGTSDAVLTAGIGHLEGSSLPVGGENTHTVLSGHRGLVSSRLFTDIDELEEGDTFNIYVLGEVLTYEVDQILTVLPTETAALAIEEGEDLCTLVTCTPYGINTHRLLVRGHRIDTVDSDELIVTADAVQIDKTKVAAFIAAIILLILFIAVLIRGRRRSSRKTGKKKIKSRRKRG